MWGGRNSDDARMARQPERVVELYPLRSAEDRNPAGLCRPLRLPAGRKAGPFIGMKIANSFAVVLVTAPDLKTARKLAQAILTARVAACVNFIPRIESHYWWQGRLESGRELLLIIKTTKRRLAALENAVLANHPYDTPEFVVLPLIGGAEKYLAWLADSVCLE